MISITEHIDVPSPPKRVWEVISDPCAVVSCIGGAELGESHDDGSFDALMAVRFGGLKVKFAARITLELDETEREGRLTARGRDGQGATRFQGGAVFRVTDDQQGGSRVEMTGEMNLSGKLASLIESGASVVVSKMTREFTAELVELCADHPTPVADTAVAALPAPSGRWRRIRKRLARLLRRRRTDAPSPAPSTATAQQPRGVKP